MRSFRSLVTIGKRLSSSSASAEAIGFNSKIGQREVVGFGINGTADYVESATFPFPAIRFREITPEFKALREKEKGSWKALSIEEKKCLYRISFCQTLAEMEAPTGEWKSVIGFGLMILSGAIWLQLFVLYLTQRELPPTFTEESRIAQLQRMIDLRMNPVSGISSKWNYETNWWKQPGDDDPKKVQ